MKFFARRRCSMRAIARDSMDASARSANDPFATSLPWP